jgi:AcrR family transcriptional regulator
MSPKVPQAYLEARRAEILEAAAKCFMEKGFHNTTMQDIYQASNLSPGAVYNYFNSKEDIVAAAAELSQQRNNTLFTEAASGNPDRALSNLVHLFLARAGSVDMALYSEANHNGRIHEALRKGQDAVAAKLVELIQYNQQAGIFNDRLNAEAVARVLISIFQGVEIQKILDPGFDLDAYGAVYEAIVDGTFSKPQKEHRRANKSAIKQKPAEKEVQE